MMLAKEYLINNLESRYKPSLVSKVTLFMIYFVFMFSIPFVFTGGIGTRALLGVCGLAYLFVRKLSVIRSILRSGKFYVEKHVVSIGLALFSIALMAGLTDFANGTSEKTFIFYPISMILIFSGAYLVTDIMRRVYRRLDFDLVSSYFIRAVIVQLVISLLLFFVPEVKLFVATIVELDEVSLSVMLDGGGFRLMGFGVQFFMAGIINCFALLLIAFRIKYYAKTFKSVFWLTISFIFVTAVGMMMSRTTMVGAGLAIGMLILGLRLGSIRFTKFFGAVKTIMVLGVVAVPLFFSLSEDIKEPLTKAGEYGFEMFVNYFETGKATTASSDQLKTMYDTYPQDVSTWIVGDGWFADPNNEGSYYMGVDVGYLRLIFYFGLVGMILFFNYQYQMLRYINYLTEGKYKLFLIIAFALLLILNLKGFTDFTQLLAIFLFIPRNDHPISDS